MRAPIRIHLEILEDLQRRRQATLETAVFLMPNVCPCSGAVPPRLDASAERAAQLAQLSLAELPSLNQVEEFLFGQRPFDAKLPLSADLLNQLRHASVLHPWSLPHLKQWTCKEPAAQAALAVEHVPSSRGVLPP